MEFIATIVAFVLKSGWGLILLILITGVIVIPLRKLSKKQKRDEKATVFSLLKIVKWGVLWVVILFAFIINLTFGGILVRPIVNKYGVETQAVMHKITDPSIMINYRDIYRYHFVFQLPDSSYQEASMLRHHMKNGYVRREKMTIKYLPLTASFYPIIIDVSN